MFCDFLNLFLDESSNDRFFFYMESKKLRKNSIYAKKLDGKLLTKQNCLN